MDIGFDCDGVFFENVAVWRLGSTFGDVTATDNHVSRMKNCTRVRLIELIIACYIVKLKHLKQIQRQLVCHSRLIFYEKTQVHQLYRCRNTGR